MITNIRISVHTCLIFLCTILYAIHPCSAEETTKNIGSENKQKQQLTSEAVAYHIQLTVLFPELRQSYYNYLKAAIKSRRIRSYEKNRQDLLKVIQKNQTHIQTCPQFHNDSTFRTELIRYLELLYIVMKEDFDKILDMEDIEAQSYDEDEAHQLALDMAFEKLNSCKDVLIKAEKIFFQQYNIKANETKDKLAEKIELANNAINYYNPIYRLFFKINKESFYAHKALEKKDLASLQQHTTTLLSLAEDGLQKLKEQRAFEGDEQLLKIVSELLEFYKYEGTVTMPANISFFLKTEDFQNAGKKIETIRPETRTKKDIDEYNKAVAAYNKAVKEINQLNNSSFKKHKALLEKWKKTVDQYFELHT